jgi:adenosylmethionine-8-amino-7-oxononanoate aminotransferase
VLANVRDRSAELAKLLDERIGSLDSVSDVRLHGLMGAVELVTGAPAARRVAAGAVRRGVLLRSLGNVVTIVPPLSVTSADIHRIITALEDAIRESDARA